MNNTNQSTLAIKITFKNTIVFTLPAIIMMVFMSLYMMVDGIFVAQFLNTDALSAVNMVFPLVSIVIGVGVMLASGSSAIIARKMGEGKSLEARQCFTLVTIFAALIGIAIFILGIIFIEPLIKILGGKGELHEYIRDYTFVLLFFIPFSVLLLLFQTLFVTAGKPAIGLTITIIGGLTNVVLDYVFIVIVEMGIKGAALATGIGYLIPALFGVLYFTFNRKGTLYFCKPKLDFRVLLRTFTNGSSEMVTNLSTAVTTLLFNIIMLRHLGTDGVAAITIVLYSQFLLTAIHFGFSTGVAPLISYNYGKAKHSELRHIFKISMIFILTSSVITVFAAQLLTEPITLIFAKRSNPVFDIAVEGFKIFSIAYLFIGINIFASAFFTAFSNGKISALLSLLRSFVFITLSLIILPMVLGVTGIWLAIPLAEVLSILVSIFFLVRNRKRYHYV